MQSNIDPTLKIFGGKVKFCAEIVINWEIIHISGCINVIFCTGFGDNLYKDICYGILYRYRKKLYVFVYALVLIQWWFTTLLKIKAMLPNLNGAKFDILGEMANSAHIRKHWTPMGNNALKRFFFRVNVRVIRKGLINRVCMSNKISITYG